jgi:hypothetical protein
LEFEDGVMAGSSRAEGIRIWMKKQKYQNYINTTGTI